MGLTIFLSNKGERMNYRELAERVLKGFLGPGHTFLGDWDLAVNDLAACLEAENVTVREPWPEGTIEVVVYVGAGKYRDGTNCVLCEAVDREYDDDAAMYAAFSDDDTHRVRAIVPVFPVSVPTVLAEGEQVN